MDQGLLIAALIGVVLAAIVYYSVPGRIKGGVVLTLVVGLVGAVGMTLLGRAVGLAMPGQTAGYFTAVIGTALVLAIWRVAMGRE